MARMELAFWCFLGEERPVGELGHDAVPTR